VRVCPLPLADNGAFYDSTNNHSGFSNHQEAILALKQRWTQQRIPFRYVQMDDWQWIDPKQAGSNVDMPGIVHWPPDPAAIPAGLTDWLGMPTSQYCPMYSAENDYITDRERYNYTWAVDVDATVGPTAIPLDVQFYRDAFANGSHAQMRMFEQDFLCTYAASTNLTKGDVTTGMTWLHAIDTAAVEANVTVQLCMMCPAHALASTELRAVTNGRGTSDNDHSSQADLYPLGHSGLLMGAVGMWPSRDNVFTTANEPNCPKGTQRPVVTNCTYPDYRLESVAALLAGGPYGPSDGIDDLNRGQIVRACRSDGVLLRADQPLATLDAALCVHHCPCHLTCPPATTWLISPPIHIHIHISLTLAPPCLSIERRTLAFDSPRGRGLLLWGTYSQIGALRWSYLLSVSTPTDNTLHLRDLDTTPALAYILRDVWADANGAGANGALRRIPQGGSFRVPQSPPAPIPGHSDGGTYQILAPVLPSGAIRSLVS
jgi:hypothetical protein